MNAPRSLSLSLAQHEQLVQALLHGDALAVPPAERTLIQTHISSLVLAGEFAYKLRKPVRLPFLDFSTAALRRDDCIEELRLNRRTAPQLYLDVLPIFGSSAKPRLGAAGDDAPGAFDWLLRMRRFDQAQLLDNMARAGTLEARHIDALARQVTAFHAAQAPSPPAFGAPETTQRWLLEALDAIAQNASALAEPARIAALRDCCVQAFAHIEPLLTQRRAQGFVREGHGDLHLANIVLVDGEPLPFDGIEFNPELRHIDVMNDIAFTFMDLLRHDLPELAWRFAGNCVELSDDHAGLATLRYFATYRALVRARVALMRAAQAIAEAKGEAAASEAESFSGVSEGRGQMARIKAQSAGVAQATASICNAEPGCLDAQGGHVRKTLSLSAHGAFERDLALAEQLAAAPGRPPLLVLACGLSGSGKSTVALHLAQRLGGVRLRSDVERKRLHGLAPTARPTPQQAALLYAQVATLSTYARLGTLARMLLRAQTDAVVDAAALRRDERDALRRLAAEEGAGFVLVECTAPEPVLRERITRRLLEGRDASDADASVLDLQLRVREPLGADEQGLTLPTDVDPEALEQRCSALAARLGAPAAALPAATVLPATVLPVKVPPVTITPP